MKVVLKQRILSVTLAQTWTCVIHMPVSNIKTSFLHKKSSDLYFFKKYLEIKMLL